MPAQVPKIPALLSSRFQAPKLKRIFSPFPKSDIKSEPRIIIKHWIKQMARTAARTIESTLDTPRLVKINETGTRSACFRLHQVEERHHLVLISKIAGYLPITVFCQERNFFIFNYFARLDLLNELLSDNRLFYSCRINLCQFLTRRAPSAGK